MLIETLFTEDQPNFKEKFKHTTQNITNHHISSVREKIIFAGKQRCIISILYNNDKRLVEPYSFRYKGGVEYFYGYNLSGGTSSLGIRSFILSKIQSVDITEKNYIPRWPIEF